jgi:protein-S-isoprenylcysteine O-methyltransferase Ste14
MAEVRTPQSRWMLSVGDALFRWRSYLPLGLLPLVGLSILRAPYPFGTEAADRAWEACCVGLSLAGMALRIWTVGVAAHGTSGRNTRKQKAESLNTTGPYSLIRHPLYLANGIIVMGLALFSHTWLLPPAVAALTLLYYSLIAWREEDFLRARFGRMWEEWAERVPRLWPAFGHFVPAARPWRWREALRREYHGLTLVLVLPFLLDVTEDLHETGAFDLDPVWTVTAAIGLVFYVTVRLLAKRTRLLRPRPS